MGGAFGTYRGEEGRVMRKPERKRQFSRPRCRLKDIVEMDLQEIQWVRGMDESGSEKGQTAGCCQHGSESSGYMKNGKCPDNLGNSS